MQNDSERKYPRICAHRGYNFVAPENTIPAFESAIALGAYKVQLFKPYFNQDSIDKAHANNILCNVFYADDPSEAKKYLDMGIDTILTNDYLIIYNALKDEIDARG